MNRHSDNPLRLFVDPFAAWRELALKTGEMIVASAWAGAARASAARVEVIDQREPVRPAAAPVVPPQPAISREAKPAIARKVKTSTPVTPKARGTKKHKKRAKRR